MKKDCEGLDEVRLAIFLRDRFIELRSPSSTGRALKKAGWSKKVARRIAKEQCADRAENEETLNSMEMAGFAYRGGSMAGTGRAMYAGDRRKRAIFVPLSIF